MFERFSKFVRKLNEDKVRLSFKDDEGVTAKVIFTKKKPDKWDFLEVQLHDKIKDKYPNLSDKEFIERGIIEIKKYQG